MKEAALVHKKEITVYYDDDGNMVELSPEKKLLAQLFNTHRIEKWIFRSTLELISYKAAKELEDKFQEALRRWSKTIDDVFEISLIKDYHGEHIVEFEVEK